MGQGSTDETIVAIKAVADEDTVTYLRIKLRQRDKRLRAKGGACKRRLFILISTIEKI
jgi:hypothetical protein